MDDCLHVFQDPGQSAGVLFFRNGSVDNIAAVVVLRSNCRMFATLPAKIFNVTIAPHEKPN